MAAEVAEPLKPDSRGSGHDLIDPEADAEDALQTLRSFVLHDLPHDSPDVAKWHGLDAYIEELCAYGIEKLTREPEDLSAERLRLKNDLEDVSCGNYRALIESFECAGAVRDGVSDVRTNLDQLVLSLPELANATRQFSSSVNVKQKERLRRLRGLSEHRAILDMLEMPRLMSTLISAELYDEALELRENSLKLATMHPDDPLICSICEEMDILTQQLVLQLLAILRKSVQLPMCLRVVGFIRRLGVFSESRLRMLFLHCRGEWMRFGVESSTAPNQQAKLVTLSDNTRANVFEIITQYRAVFSDDEDDEDDMEYLMNGTENDKGPISSSAAILYDWTSSCITEYLDKLGDGVQEIADGAALNTVLQQAMSCGQSLGRVGADFRAALVPLFENAVLRIYNSHLHAALRQFEMMIEDNRWAPVGSSALRKERNHLYDLGNRNGVEESVSTEPPTTEQSSDSDAYEPPAGILDSPPLAVFLNGVLAALNDLRLCAPVSLGPLLGESLQETLTSAGEYMSAIGGPGGTFLKRSDRSHFLSMSVLLRDLCVQHAARCLDFCMNRNGLVNVHKIRDRLTELFGESLLPVSLSEETKARLNGSGEDVHSADEPAKHAVTTDDESRGSIDAENEESNTTGNQEVDGTDVATSPSVPETNENSLSDASNADNQRQPSSSSPSNENIIV